jgi:mRNA interferase RelE/StbE
MNTHFNTSFFRDVKKAPSVLRSEVDRAIIQIENAVSLKEISDVKKLKGYKTAYRIKIGTYRLCFLYDDNVIIITRFLPRKDVYRFFP